MGMTGQKPSAASFSRNPGTDMHGTFIGAERLIATAANGPARDGGKMRRREAQCEAFLPASSSVNADMRHRMA